MRQPLPPRERLRRGYDIAEAVADAACRAGSDLHARTIVAFTRTGVKFSAGRDSSDRKFRGHPGIVLDPGIIGKICMQAG